MRLDPDSRLDTEAILSFGFSLVGVTMACFSVLSWSQESYDWSTGHCGTLNAVRYCSYFLPGHYTAIYSALILGLGFVLAGLVFAYRRWRSTRFVM